MTPERAKVGGKKRIYIFYFQQCILYSILSKTFGDVPLNDTKEYQTKPTTTKHKPLLQQNKQRTQTMAITVNNNKYQNN